MSSPPWAAASSREQLFVLLTGANSGVGLGIGQRMIDEFLASRSLTSHLILIPTTRSAKKSTETILALRSYLKKAANSPKLRSRAGPSYNPESTVSRVHVYSVQIDLCKLASVYAAADALVSGEITDPTGVLPDVAIPRLDVVIFNAGIGGWENLSWFGLAWQIITRGLPQAVTYPEFKISEPRMIAAPQLTEPAKGQANGNGKASKEPVMGQVFCANVFGHYILAHELLPLLTRPSTEEAPARVIWTSSIDAETKHLNFDDFQGIESIGAYESSKRLTDLMILSVGLPSVRKINSDYFTPRSPPKGVASPNTRSTRSKKPAPGVPPKFYLSHPGVVATGLFPLSIILFWLYWAVMYVARWVGSTWHPVEGYTAAVSTTWLALEDQEKLDDMKAELSKWGSSTNRMGLAAPKKTEVMGWGWEGKILSQEEMNKTRSDGYLSKTRGRKWDAVELTKEGQAQFEEDAVDTWDEMESLREEWESIMGRE